jgi:hypothetical protein
MVWLWLFSQTRLGPGPRQQGRQVQEEGFPTLGTERSAEWMGRSVAEVCTSEARKIGGCLLSRARDGVPQQAWFPWLCTERMNAPGEGVAGRNGPLRRVSEDGGVIAGRKPQKRPPSTWSICFRSYSLSNAVEERNRAKMGEDSSRAYNSRKGRTDLCVLG